MSSITITVSDKTPEFFARLDAAIRRFVRKAGPYIEGQIKASMAQPKSGAVRTDKAKRGSTKYARSHIVSAPGESPAIDSSNLIGSIQTIIENNGLMAKIGTPVEYATYLEDGTSRMNARPVWEVERMEALPTLEKMLAAEIGR